MASKMLVGLLLGLGLFISPANAEAPIAPRPAPVDIRTYVQDAAVAAHISPIKVANVIQCESQWNPAAVGDHGTSFGLVQIHEWPGVTHEMALDPYFSADFLIQHWGERERWTCARLLGY